MLNPRRLLPILLSLLLLTPWLAPARADDKAPATAPAPVIRERWYTVEMFGQVAGWAKMVQRTDADTITSDSEMRIEFKRGELTIPISMSSSFVETKAGKPLSMSTTQGMGKEPITTRFAFKDDGIEQTTLQNGRASTKMLPKIAGEWLPPAAVERYVLDRVKAGDKAITVRTIDPLSSTSPVEITRTDGTPVEHQHNGRTINATKYTLTTRGGSLPFAVTATEIVDDEQQMLQSDTSVGGVKVVMRLSTREEATGKSTPPEVMISTFIRPDRAIPNARSTTAASYLLTLKGEEAIPEIPSTGAQKPESLSPTQIRLHVSTTFPNAAPRADATNAEFLAASSMCDFRDPAVAALAAEALKDAPPGKPERAETLRRKVHAFIKKKNLGVGFANASEIARSGEGDCTEHGVLLAALLRADAIPSRVASGLIYADAFAGDREIFGYHMWAQALLEVKGQLRWVDLDATLPPATPFDATHITLGLSDLGDDGAIGSLASIATLLGRLEIRVEDVR